MQKGNQFIMTNIHLDQEDITRQKEGIVSLRIDLSQSLERLREKD